MQKDYSTDFQRKTANYKAQVRHTSKFRQALYWAFLGLVLGLVATYFSRPAIVEVAATDAPAEKEAMEVEKNPHQKVIKLQLPKAQEHS